MRHTKHIQSPVYNTYVSPSPLNTTSPLPPSTPCLPFPPQHHVSPSPLNTTSPLPPSTPRLPFPPQHYICPTPLNTTSPLPPSTPRLPYPPQHYVFPSPLNTTSLLPPSPLWSNGVSLQQSHGVLPGSPHDPLLQPHGGDYQFKPLQVREQDMLNSWQPFCTLHDGCHQSMHHGLQFRARWAEDNLRCFHYKLNTEHLRTCEGREMRRGSGRVYARV